MATARQLKIQVSEEKTAENTGEKILVFPGGKIQSLLRDCGLTMPRGICSFKDLIKWIHEKLPTVPFEDAEHLFDLADFLKIDLDISGAMARAK